MGKPLTIVVVLLTIVVGSFAQNQVASVTSTQPFQLRGARVDPGNGVPSWPLMAGDSVGPGPGLVIITFNDGSNVGLCPDSTGKVDIAGTTPSFQLQSGVARYSLRVLLAVKLLILEKLVVNSSLQGTLRIAKKPCDWGLAAAARIGANGKPMTGAGEMAAVATGMAAAFSSVVASQSITGGTSLSPIR